jgi:hypothetical protein
MEEEIEKQTEEIIKQQQEIGENNNLYSTYSSSSSSSSLSLSQTSIKYSGIKLQIIHNLQKRLIEYYDKISSYILPVLSQRQAIIIKQIS